MAITKIKVDGVLYEIEGVAPKEYEITITFENGRYTSTWDFTKVYDDYGYPSGSGLPNANLLGEFDTVNDTITVKTTTGKIGIVVSANGLISPGSTTTTGGVSFLGMNGGLGITCYQFDITDNGTITVSGTSYDD